MVLRLVNGPMLEKSNRTGPLADRQKILLTARLRVSLFLFQLPGKREIFRKFFETSGKFPKSSEFPKIFAVHFFELDYFDIFF